MRKLIPDFSMCLVLSFFLTSFVCAQDEEKPSIVNLVPKNVPIKVEIIAPENAEDYPEKIQVKVTNTGEKPIYFINMSLRHITDEVILGPDGKRAWRVIPLRYGRHELGSAFKDSPIEADSSVSPNESYTFEFSKYYAAVKEQQKRGGFYRPAMVYHLVLWEIGYGDGSGFSGGRSFSKKTEFFGQPA